GAWPPGQLSPEDERGFRDRIQRYMTKALKEAKSHTSWIDQNGAYEEAVHAFIETILDRSSPNPFLDDFLRFQAKIAEYGIYNALAQTLVKITAPGIPDFYQGSALWDLRLVDPDNRGAVNYEVRSRLLADLHARCKGNVVNRKRLVRELIKTRTDGRIKCYVTATALHYRRVHPSLFLEGDYLPLKGHGRKKDHLCAFARVHGEKTVITVVPRFVAGLVSDAKTLPYGKAIWGDTALSLPPGEAVSPYHNLFTGERVSPIAVKGQPVLLLAQLFDTFPVALLERVT
ncbi:MAG: malto-oligosyltrehalose synthase, partial [Nitrospiria bacterium]